MVACRQDTQIFALLIEYIDQHLAKDIKYQTEKISLSIRETALHNLDDIYQKLSSEY